MAGERTAKPMGEAVARCLARGRVFVNVVFFSAGILVGLYVSGLSHGHSTLETAGPKMGLKSQFEVASFTQPQAGPATNCVCPQVQGTVKSGDGVPPNDSAGQRQQRETLAESAKQVGKAGLRSSSSDNAVVLSSPKRLKEAAGIDFLGFTDGKAAFDAFYSYMPYNMRDQTKEEAMLLATVGSGLKRPRSSKPGDQVDLNTLSTCKEVDVLLLSKGRCYVALQTDLLFTSYHVQRYKHEPSGDAPWQMLPRITKEGSFPPLPINRAKHESFLRTLFNNLPGLEMEARRILQQAADSKNRVLIMAMNQGDVDMLLNFLCSAHEHRLPIDNLVVFGGDQVVADIARSLGIKAFWHPAFGELPTAHAKHYGDAGFLAMMWLKIVSVWVAVRLGFDVLFQDADLVWFRDPWSVFEDPSVDGFFMDDGSRSERFSPLYANSGFYFLRSNPRIQHFMQTLLFSYDMIVQYASHQTIFIQALQEHISRNALRVKLLRDVDFVGGKVFHHRKELMEQIRTGEYVPYTFHMCWTQTKADKLQNVKKAGLWFLQDECSAFDDIAQLAQDGALGLASCCYNPRGGHRPPEPAVPDGIAAA